MFDIYQSLSDPAERMATRHGAGLPEHVARKDWGLMPASLNPGHRRRGRRYSRPRLQLLQTGLMLGGNEAWPRLWRLAKQFKARQPPRIKQMPI